MEEQDEHDEESTVIVTASDEDKSSSDGSDRPQSRMSRLRIFLAVSSAALCLSLAFLAGRASSPAQGQEAFHTPPVRFYRTHADRQLDPGVVLTPGPPKKVVPFQYLTALTTQLELINVSKTGDGWAPWQLVVAGNAADKGQFCDDDDPNLKCKKHRRNPDWVNFNGVWTLWLDPEKELAEDEEYEDEEIIETRFQVTFTNRLEEPTLIHFHGLVPPNNLDGIPFISANPIQPHHTVFYDFMLYHRGFYWLHSHFSHHAGSGLFAPLIVRDHPKFRAQLGQPQDVLMVIYEAHWRALCAYARNMYPDECPIGGFDGWNQYTFNVNGHSLQGKKPSVAEAIVKPGRPARLRILDAGTMASYRVSMGNLEGELIALDGRRVKRGKYVREVMIASANRVDVLLQIPLGEGCYPIVATRASAMNEKHTEQVALMIKTAKGECPKVEPYSPGAVKAFTIRDWSHFTGDVQAENSLRHPTKKPDVHYTVHLTGTYDKVTGEWRPGFSIDTHELHIWPTRVWCKVLDHCEARVDTTAHTVLKSKMCQGEERITNMKCEDFKCKDEDVANKDGRCLPDYVTLDKWKGVHVSECHFWKVRPAIFKFNQDALEVCHGDRVWLTYTNQGTGEIHPIHLHGTHQQLVEVDGKSQIGPLRDTWFLAEGQTITVAFDALNPGEWLLHCHYEHHLVSGMATTLRYVMNDRCRARLDDQKLPDWRQTDPVPESQWPEDWHKLWDKKDPTADCPITNGCGRIGKETLER